jgi:hypothetical protein
MILAEGCRSLWFAMPFFGSFLAIKNLYIEA